MVSTRQVTLLLLVALAAACNTTAKSSIQGIDVPGTLSEWQVEFAILAALADQPPPEGLSPEVEITDRALEAWFGWRYNSMRDERRRWFFEGRSEATIYAGFQRGKYYVRVSIPYSASRVDFHVDGSRNLRESDWAIHRSAIRWIQDLEVGIRRSLGRLSAPLRPS